MKKFLLPGIAVTLVLSVVAFGANPAWWSDSTNGTLFIDTGATANNYAPLNIGQLKNVATKAKKYLDIQLQPLGGSGPAVTELVNGFSNNTTVNYQVANLGQLKAVGKVFYDRLVQVGYNTQANLVTRGFDTSWPYDYPWNPYLPVAQNYNAANLGQLKMVFSFDVSSANLTGAVDTNHNGLLDSWEMSRYGNLTAGNLTRDTDGDGIPDYEDANPSNATVKALTIIIDYPANGGSY